MYLKECIGKVESLPASATIVSARGLRYGGCSICSSTRGWTLDEKETRNTSLTYSVGNFDVLKNK